MIWNRCLGFEIPLKSIQTHSFAHSLPFGENKKYFNCSISQSICIQHKTDVDKSSLVLFTTESCGRCLITVQDFIRSGIGSEKDNTFVNSLREWHSIFVKLMKRNRKDAGKPELKTWRRNTVKTWLHCSPDGVLDFTISQSPALLSENVVRMSDYWRWYHNHLVFKARTARSVWWSY